MNPPARPDYWQLMPVTPDVSLRKIARDNITVAQIIKGNRCFCEISLFMYLVFLGDKKSKQSNFN